MLNYIAADLGRIFRRVPRIVLMLVSFAVFCAAVMIFVTIFNIFSEPEVIEAGIEIAANENIVFDAIGVIAGYAAGLLGLFELIFVFSDDIKAKTTQIAIGVGISRTQVVLSKFFELLILLIADMIVMLGLSALMGVFLGSALNGAQMIQLFKTLSVDIVLSNIAYSSLVFVLVFTTQSMTLAILGFLALNFHIVSGIIGLTGYIKALQGLNLSSYSLTTMIGKIGGMAEGAGLSLTPFLGYAAYIIVFLMIACLFFRKKELEF